MKTETKENESMVAQLRKIRDQIGLEIQDMTPQEVFEYYNQKEGLLPKEVWEQAKKEKIRKF